MSVASSINGSKAQLYAPPSSRFAPSFWEELYKKVLNEYRLNTPRVELRPHVIPSAGGAKPEATGSVNFSREAFDSDVDDATTFPCELRLFTTMEAFRDSDKKVELTTVGDELLEDLISGAAVRDPSLLMRSKLLCHSDLKTYNFLFWYAAPVIVPLQPYTTLGESSVSEELRTAIYQFVYGKLSSKQSIPVVFAVNERGDAISTSDAWLEREKVTWVLLDSASSSGLGWTARNLLSMLALHTPVNEPRNVKLISLRNPMLFSHMSAPTKAITTPFTMNELLEQDGSTQHTIKVDLESLCPNASSPEEVFTSMRERHSYVGWEPNERGKAGPRRADISGVIDSATAMRQAVDLNLRLMKWRQWPDLDVDRLAATRCLLIGAGTLGCAVARALLGWGVRTLTFVDNGRVSFSNPARQMLFEFADAVERKPKAVAAAEALRRIRPDVESRGEIFTIPMPGHPYSSAADGSNECSEELARRRLDELVAEHDVVFLLTDSREARWLPTVVAKAAGRMLIGAALGFDSFVIMRHGHAHWKHGSDGLGCYFCNDVVAASNSQRNRSLDQQCTVTRPGLSFLAGAYAAEFLVGLLETDGKTESGLCPPHQIRATLNGFTSMSLETPSFPQCTACSPAIIEAYQQDPAGLVRTACADPSSLESVSGITDLLAEVDLDDLLEGGDEDDF